MIRLGSVALSALVITLSTGLSAWAESKLELEEAEITGARELPKVLYIVPWKKTQPGEHALPMRSLIDEAISPIDVDVFKRQVRYYDLTRPPVADKQ
ncbi:hypothetical protein [Kaarinaea lacus]